MRVISPVSLPTYLSVVYRNNMSAVPASIHLKTNVDRIYLLLLKTVLSFPSLLSKTMSIFQDFFKTFLQFSQIQDYFQDLNEFINFKTFSSLEENVRTMQENTGLGTECACKFCAWIVPLELSVVLVVFSVIYWQTDFRS